MHCKYNRYAKLIHLKCNNISSQSAKVPKNFPHNAHSSLSRFVRSPNYLQNTEKEANFAPYKGVLVARCFQFTRVPRPPEQGQTRCGQQLHTKGHSLTHTLTATAPHFPVTILSYFRSQL